MYRISEQISLVNIKPSSSLDQNLKVPGPAKVKAWFALKRSNRFKANASCDGGASMALKRAHGLEAITRDI